MFSKLYPKVLLIASTIVFIYAISYYFFIISRIQNNSVDIENKLGKAQLEKAVEIIKSSDDELTAYSDFALEVHKNELKKLTAPIWNLVEDSEEKSRSLSTKDMGKKKKVLIELIEKLRYSDNGYFFISDYNSTLISHPYLHGDNLSTTKDIYGNLVVPPMIKIARENGEGYYSYWWWKNDIEQEVYEKLTYAKIFKPWKWVVMTGIYIDDIDKEIAHRKELLIQRLKNILSNTVIGKSGYLYIFDSNANMIIHPDKNMQGNIFGKMKNNSTGNYIFDDLVNSYKSGVKKLHYIWDAPGDRGNFSYEKVSWIEYNSYFDWYICSSGYIDDFHAQSKFLTKYLIYAGSAITILVTFLSLYFIRSIIIIPILRLSNISKKVNQGDITVRYTDSINNDEIGMLALGFNQMLDTINRQITTLDSDVKDRTRELSASLDEKETLLRELHHRVKNNLFIISGIIGLQSFQDRDISSADLIQSIQNRIQAIALTHELLSQNEAEAYINMKDYIEKLCNSLFLAFSHNRKKYLYEYDLDDIALSLNQVYSVGLVVNELVTNAIKYAFIDDNSFIKVSLKIDKDDNIILKIEDNGPGFKSTKSTGIGLEFVNMSVEQLDGTISFSFDSGTHITIIFPIVF